MTKTLTQLGKRAVTCSKWKWVPGMKVVGRRGLPEAWFRCEYGDGPFVGEWSNAVPDLTDPATVGCLLALIREVWCDSDIYVERGDFRDQLRWHVVSPFTDGIPLLLGAGDTEAEALIEALTAASKSC